MQKDGLHNYRITVGISAFAALALLPFTVRHAMADNWYLAGIIGGLNVLLVLGSVWLYRRRHDSAVVCLAGYAIVAAANLVALLSIQAQGGHAAYWIYPIIFANFYLLPFVAGTVVSIAFSGLALLFVSPLVPSEYLMRLMVTTPLCIFFGVVFSLGLSRQRRQLQYLASHDALTGLGNRHSLNVGLEDAVARKKRYEERCSVIMLDIDEFKVINDSMGHMHADVVIVELARLLSDRIRSVDRVYRFGGEEFVLLLPHASARSSWQLAEALRMDIEEHQFTGRTRITVSAGVAEIGTGEDAEHWLKRADDALFRAKAAGRNCVVSALAAHRDDDPGRHPVEESREYPRHAPEERRELASRGGRLPH